MKNFLLKLKSIKHIEYIVALIFIVAILLIYFSNSSGKTKTESTRTNSTNIYDYIDNLESDIESVLLKVNGVNSCNVLITLNLQEASVNNSNITLDKFPSVKGIIVVADVSDTYAKMSIIEAIEAIIDVNRDNIQILKS